MEINNARNYSAATSLVLEFMEWKDAETCLDVSGPKSSNSVFSVSGLPAEVTRGFYWLWENVEGFSYDFILGDLSLGTKEMEEFKFGSQKIKIRKNWAVILKSIILLNKNGMALFFVEPAFFSSQEGSMLEESLNKKGYYVNAIFNGYKDAGSPTSPLFVLISKRQSNSVFLAELSGKLQALQVARNYCTKEISNDLFRGIEIEEGTFSGFHKAKVKLQIEKLKTQYKEFEKYSIGDIVKEVISAASGCNLEERYNSVYIPKLGKSPVVSKLSETTIKHQNYFQVVLGEKASNEYMVAFFRSDLGKLTLQSLTTEVTIPRINKRDIEQVVVALPSIDVQEEILVTHRKLEKLRTKIDRLDSELALNPTSSSVIDSMLESIGGLTEADKVRKLIRQGESKTVELKETLDLDVKKKTKEKYIQESALKTIVGFMNAEGGTLLVGVADNGDITGIDGEMNKFHKNSSDKYLLHVKNLVKARIGEQYYPYIDHKIITVNQRSILKVNCKKSDEPCYLDKEDFYVRTNPATDKLKGPKMVAYIQNHWPST